MEKTLDFAQIHAQFSSSPSFQHLTDLSLQGACVTLSQGACQLRTSKDEAITAFQAKQNISPLST